MHTFIPSNRFFVGLNSNEGRKICIAEIIHGS